MGRHASRRHRPCCSRWGEAMSVCYDCQRSTSGLCVSHATLTMNEKPPPMTWGQTVGVDHELREARAEVERLRAALDLVQDSADNEAIRKFLAEENQ